MVDSFWAGEELPQTDFLSAKTDDDWFKYKDVSAHSWKTIPEKTYKKCVLDSKAARQPGDE